MRFLFRLNWAQNAGDCDAGVSNYACLATERTENFEIFLSQLCGLCGKERFSLLTLDTPSDAYRNTKTSGPCELMSGRNSPYGTVTVCAPAAYGAT